MQQICLYVRKCHGRLLRASESNATVTIYIYIQYHDHHKHMIRISLSPWKETLFSTSSSEHTIWRESALTPFWFESSEINSASCNMNSGSICRIAAKIRCRRIKKEWRSNLASVVARGCQVHESGWLNYDYQNRLQRIPRYRRQSEQLMPYIANKHQ